MRRNWRLLVVLCLVLVGSYAMPQEVEKHGQEEEKRGAEPENNAPSVASVLSSSITHVNRIMFNMAMTMPEEKYGFAPSGAEFKNVRTFGEQIKHVAAANFIYAASMLGEKPPVDVGENEDGPSALKTKAEIIQYMKRSFAYAQKAVRSIDEKNVVSPYKNPFGDGQATRLSMAVYIIGHCYDHYGQLDQYLRLSGMETPAARR